MCCGGCGGWRDSTARTRSSSAARRPLRIRASWRSQLIEKKVEVIEENGAPAAEKLFVFYNPPMVNRNLGIRRSYLNETTRVAKELLARKLQTIVFANSRLHTEVLLTYLQQANRPQPGQAEPIRGYRGGYLPSERREIERGLREGRIRGVVATNALELGIDIGSLDACVMAGYAGSIASTWQRAGARGKAQRDVLRRAGGVVRAARSIHRAASGLFFRALARARLRAAGQPRNSGEPFEMRRIRAAVVTGRHVRQRGRGDAMRAPGRSGLSASQRRKLALGAAGVSGRHGEPARGNVGQLHHHRHDRRGGRQARR